MNHILKLGTAALVVLGACSSDGDDAAKADTAGAAIAADTPAAGAMPPAGMDSPRAAAAPAGPRGDAAFVDPDAATREQLLTLPGMTAAMADALIKARPIENMREIDALLTRANLKEAQRDSIYTRLWKPIDLNTAGREEILLIPGVGNRMLGEFLEYRPYRTMDQFRREIGKYVDDDELARLERYVTIR